MCKYCEIEYAEQQYEDSEYCLWIDADQPDEMFCIEPYFNKEFPAILHHNYGWDKTREAYFKWGTVEINFCPWCGRDLREN